MREQGPRLSQFTDGEKEGPERANNMRSVTQPLSPPQRLFLTLRTGSVLLEK